jgi:hypothetical protein
MRAGVDRNGRLAREHGPRLRHKSIVYTSEAASFEGRAMRKDR